MFDSANTSPDSASTDSVHAGEVATVRGLCPTSIDEAFDAIVDQLRPSECVDLWRVMRSTIAAYEALAFRAMLAVKAHFEAGGESVNQAFEGAAAEFQLAGMLTRGKAKSMLATAEGIYERLPQLGAALADGAIDTDRARVFIEGTSHIPQSQARQIVAELLDAAGDKTTGQLRRTIRRRCIERDPAGAHDRYEHALQQRRVATHSTPEGTASLHILDAPPDQVASAAKLINQIARRRKRRGDTASIDQIRTDVALDLLHNRINQSDTPARGGGVHIHADIETLSGLADRPGELAGYGPVVADVARQIAKKQTAVPWTYIATDSDSGRILDVGTTKRRPTAEQERWVKATHPVCVFPGCTMPAQESDLDHRTPWHEVGRTNAGDLYPECRHHHRVRHEHGWTYKRLPDGSIEHTTRLGRRYRTRPPP